MLSVTPRFLAALRQSHTVSVAAFLYRPSAPTVAVEVQVIGGILSADRDARIRRRATLEVAFDLADQTTQDAIRELPFGGQARIERGIRYANGDIERVPVGRFRVDAITWTELQGRATLTLSDRMAQVQDEAFTTPWAPGGMKPSDAIKAAVEAVWGASITYKILTNPATEATLSDVIYEEDRGAAIGDLASTITAEAYFDAAGDFVLKPRATIADPPVWTFDAGPEGVLVESLEALDRSAVRNGVAVRGQDAATTAPIYALATDADPTSPTRWGGPFGRVPLIVSSTAIQTQAQADSTAASLLNLRLGLARTLALRGIPNPALELGDVIEVVHADERDESQLINAIELDLGAGSSLGLTTTSHYRPEALRSKRRIVSGDAAWRELAKATA